MLGLRSPSFSVIVITSLIIHRTRLSTVGDRTLTVVAAPSPPSPVCRTSHRHYGLSAVVQSSSLQPLLPRLFVVPMNWQFFHYRHTNCFRFLLTCLRLWEWKEKGDAPIRWWRLRRESADWQHSAVSRCWSFAERRRPCCSGCQTRCRNRDCWAAPVGIACCTNSKDHSSVGTPGMLGRRRLDLRSVPPRSTHPGSHTHRQSSPLDRRRQISCNQ